MQNIVIRGKQKLLIIDRYRLAYFKNICMVIYPHVVLIRNMLLIDNKISVHDK
jgi:hypothetical protein